MAGPSERRAELLGWIAASRRLQYRVGAGLVIAAVVAIILITVTPTIGKISLGLVAIVAVCAFWVTGSHILDWRNRLEELARNERIKAQQAEEQAARQAKRQAAAKSE